MPHNAAFHLGLHYLLRQKRSSEIEIQYYSKTCLKRLLKKKTKISFQDRLSLNAGQKYCRMLQDSILQYFRSALSYHLVFKICVLSFFECPLKTGFTVVGYFTLNSYTMYNGPSLVYLIKPEGRIHLCIKGLTSDCISLQEIALS